MGQSNEESRQQLWQHVDDAVVRAWQTTDSTWQDKRLVHIQTALDNPLADALIWGLRHPAVYFRDPVTGVETVGIGKLMSVEESGRDAMGQAKQAITSCDVPGGLSWFGGFSFDPARPLQGIWEEWSDAVWFVPVLTIVRRQGQTTVDISFVSDASGTIEEIQSILADLRSSEVSTGNPAYTTRLQGDADEGGDDANAQRDWTELVNHALLEIQAGRLKKVVLARQVVTQVQVSLSEALERMSSQYENSNLFAYLWNGVWFVGASPETLVRMERGNLNVDCLAGSIARGTDSDSDAKLADALMNSEKNRNEHQAVVGFVKERLNLVAEDIAFSPTPSMKKLANVQHLYTPVTGRIKSGNHLFDAVAVLHPTPAVGGVPSAEALEFIRANEKWPRGYYAGAVGWTDNRGQNGLFCVGLRSAAIDYPEARLFAGCGIVQGSNADDEWRETEMKLTPMRFALQ